MVSDKQLVELQERVRQLEGVLKNEGNIAKFNLSNDIQDRNTIYGECTETISKNRLVRIWYTASDSYLPNIEYLDWPTASEPFDSIAFLYGISLENGTIGEQIVIQISGVCYVEIPVYTFAHYSGYRNISPGTNLGVVDASGRVGASKDSATDGRCLIALEHAVINDTVVLVKIDNGINNALTVLVKIVSGTGEDHVADIYANGKDAPITGNNVAIKVLSIDSGTSIAVDTWLFAWRQVWDNGGVDQLYWTVEYIVPGGGGICVQITSKVVTDVPPVDNHYLCSVFGNGYRDDAGVPVAATETDKNLWIDQIAAGSTIPTTTRLRATKIGTHYEADVPRWL